MEVRLSPKAQKYLDRLNEPEKGQVLNALEKLSREPPKGNIKKMSGRADYRLRTGGIRALFEIRKNEIFVTDIDRRGQVYKGKGKHK
jgi:mRNA interferase RelE/StbE